MIDIEFYMKVFSLKQRLMAGEEFSRRYIFDQFEKFRSKEPILYNFETTNACNMRCEMCPRTTMMTRKIETIDNQVFKNVVEQVKPFSDASWQNWQDFVEKNYHIPRNDMSENHFFLHVIPKVIVLHGYGDPLLDKHMAERCRILAEKHIPSYFSCNPANINIKRTRAMFENGLDYIKYSIESVDDIRHKEIRGQASNFTDSYHRIMQLIEMKEKHNYKTTIVITMLNLKSWQQEEFQKLTEAFKGRDVYIYLKSQDQQWYQDRNEGTKSIHWQEFCQFPWTSMTIKSNGEAAMCVEDFNNEIILGNVRTESLYDIWNGEKYRKFREDHFNLTPGIKCTQQCDMKLIGNMNLVLGSK
ncbi:radical SAM/SPASM domain-containing protein [Chloroflexota bacterium]